METWINIDGNEYPPAWEFNFRPETGDKITVKTEHGHSICEIIEIHFINPDLGDPIKPVMHLKCEIIKKDELV